VLLGALVAVATAGASACGSNALDDLVRSIARSQSVEADDVRVALQRFASSDDEMLDLARQWDSALPEQALPDLVVVVEQVDEVDAAARASLRSAACSAIADVLAGEPVPSGEWFLSNYVEAFVLQQIPGGELLSLTAEFDELWADAVAGELTYWDVRLTLMEIRYC
jgi:hypothetical protein